MIKNILLSLITLIAITLPQQSLALTPAEEDAQEVYSSVMSPFCEARLLKDCPSSQATELKHKILADLQAGKPKDLIIKEFYEKYGDKFRAAPKNSGFGRAAWLMPFIFIFLGAGLIWGWLKSNKTNGVKANSELPTGNLSDDMKARISRELES